MAQRTLDFEDDPLQLMTVDEIYERADEALLRRLAEDRRIERKSSTYSGEKLGSYFSMWANTPPDGGLLVLGQRNDGSFDGCGSLGPKELNQRETTGHTFAPDARYEHRRVAVVNDQGKKDFAVLYRVKYNPDVVVKTTAQKAFTRQGDTNHELTPEEIREVQADKGEISFESQPVLALSWPDDFNISEVGKYLRAVRTKRNVPDTLTDEEVLELRRLGKIQKGSFTPNIACTLLFAIDPLRIQPGCKIRFLRFEGEQERFGKEYNAVKDIILEGTVPELIRQADEILESQLRTFSPLDTKQKFYPVPEYPKEAWYEAVVNACVHRSYGNGLKNMPIFVKMFDDRLEIESPGPFPPCVTPENIYDTHHPRNPALMDAMYHMEYVRCAHEGTRRIRKTMSDMRLPSPEFRQERQGPPIVRVVLRNNVKQRRAWIDRDISKIVSTALAGSLSELERRALNIVAENQGTTISDANKALDITWGSARKLLLGLARKRILQYIRFIPMEKNQRDPRAFFRLRSDIDLPEGAFEQIVE